MTVITTMMTTQQIDKSQPLFLKNLDPYNNIQVLTIHASPPIIKWHLT